MKQFFLQLKRPWSFGALFYVLLFTTGVMKTSSVGEDEALDGKLQQAATVAAKWYAQHFQKQYTKALGENDPKAFVQGVIDRLRQALGAEDENNYLIKSLMMRTIDHGKKGDFDVFAFDYASPYERDLLALQLTLDHQRLAAKITQSKLPRPVEVINNNQHMLNKINLLESPMLRKYISLSKGSDKDLSKLCVLYDMYSIAGRLDLRISSYRLVKLLYPYAASSLQPLAKLDQAERDRFTQNTQAIINVAKKLKRHNHLLFDWTEQIMQVLVSKLTKADPFVNALLAEILRVLRFLDALPPKYDQQCLLYSFLNDLVFVLMIYVQPYEYLDFQRTMQEVFSRRFPVDKKIKIRHYAATSGLDALWMSYLAVNARPNLTVKEKRNPEVLPLVQDNLDLAMYFEFEGLVKIINLPDPFAKKPKKPLLSRLKQVMIKDPERPIFVFGLTSNALKLVDGKVPEPDVAGVVKRCKDCIKAFKLGSSSYVTLIIDRTVEMPENDPVGVILEELNNEIRSGKVNVLVCKSLQKFCNLGAAKYKAGCVTLINNGDAKFKACKNYLDLFSRQNFADNDEWQFALLQFMACPTGELDFVRKASENAVKLCDFINQNLKLEGERKVVAQGPLVFINTSMIWDLKVRWLPKLPGVDSFGFVFTSNLYLGNVMRISCGLEPDIEGYLQSLIDSDATANSPAE